MRLQQTIQVPLFLPPWSPLPNYASITASGGQRRQAFSISAAIQTQNLGDPATFALNRIASYLPNIIGLSAVELLPNAGTGNPISFQSAQYLEPGYAAFFQVNGTTALFKLINQPRTPATYAAAPIIERDYVYNNLMPITLANFREPIQFRQQPGFYFATTSPNGSAFANLFNGASLVPYDAWRIGAQLFTWVWGSVAKYSQSVSPDGNHYFFIGANGSHTKLVFPFRPRLLTGTPADVSGVMVEPTFDNAALQTAFSADATYDVYPYFNGWIIVLRTNGAGPTGQVNEIAVCDFGMTVYNLLKLAPQEGTGVTAVNRASGVWQPQIDTNGIFYWNSGLAADVLPVWYSYSPIPWAYPQIAYAPPPPVMLPCFNPCNPLNPEGF